jgi:outer membrane receptor protein involved in Fe transport
MDTADLRITYSPATFRFDRAVTIDATNVAVVTALTEILFRSGLDVLIDRDGAIALVPCDHHSQHPERTLQDSGMIVGTVSDTRTGEPIDGAVVTVAGTGLLAATNGSGNYILPKVPVGIQRLTARFIGYAASSMEVTVHATEQVTANFSLARSVQSLDELVTVTPGGMQTQLKAVPTAISIVSSEQIQAQRPLTFNEVFRQLVPSAVGFHSPIQPASTAFSLRGASTLSTTGQVKILVDGIEAANAGITPIDPESIERVEVIRGPQAATVFGPNAASGVVQVFTKRGGTTPETEVQLRAEAGVQQTPYAGFRSVGRQSVAAVVRGGGNQANYNLGASYWRMPDWLPDGELSGQSTPSVFGGLRYSEGILSVDLSGRYHVSNTGLAVNPELLEAGFVPASRPRYTPQKFTNETFGIRAQLNPSPWWTNQVSVGVDRSVFESIQERRRLTTPADTLLLVLENTTDKVTLSYNSSLRWSPSRQTSATITAGFDYLRLPASQALTTQALTTEGTIRLAPGGVFTVSRTVVTNAGFFTQVELGIAERLFLTAGLRMDENSTFGDELGAPLSPRAGVAYNGGFGATLLKARASYGRAIRSASPGQAFGNVLPAQITLANPFLAPEQQRGWDAGIDAWFGNAASLSFSVFDQTAYDLISFVQTATQPVPTFQWQNVGRINNWGIELEGGVVLTPRFRVSGQYSLVQSRIEDLGPNFTGSERVGDRPLGIPKHTAGGAIQFTPRTGTTLAAGVTHVGQFPQLDQVALLRCLGGTGPCQPTPRDYIVEFDGFTKFNATVTQQLDQRITAFLSIDNLTNNLAFEGSNGLAVAGRLSTLGIQVRN